MKYLFVLGRNPELSKREVLSYFKKEANPVLNFELNNNGLLIEVKNSIDPKIVNSFGGVLAIGEIIVESKFSELDGKLNEKMIYLGEENKLTYVIWDFSSNYEFIQDYLKKRFKEEKIKATEKHLTGNIKMQNGEEIEIPSSKLLDEEYFLFEGKEKEYFGKIISHCDYESLEKRDMEKPIRRESLAISPRLAKIMINLAELKPEDKLLDPFCGVGTVLQEALLQGINVVGVDKDEKAIKGSEKNLKWFGFSENDYLLINFDSTKVNIPEVSGVTTEPDLGETLKKIPTKNHAEKTLKNFEKLMVQVINNIKGNVKGKIVFTSPYIRIGKIRLSCDIENICSRTGHSLVEEGISEFRDNQVVGRMIYVLKKNKL
ncbi:MAG TPA: DNA methyltransferase [Candidatus Nanoarchaeia archaeon]|nr:DNA methyltransferase [Candidatus Nanoarchaeia archaeon]